MSTPLFIREPVIGRIQALGGGVDPEPFLLGPNLAEAVEEATLVEEIIWFQEASLPGGGAIVIYLQAPDDVRLEVLRFEVADTGDFRTGRERIDITLPAGWKMYASHDVGTEGMQLHALGGIVR